MHDESEARRRELAAHSLGAAVPWRYRSQGHSQTLAHPAPAHARLTSARHARTFVVVSKLGAPPGARDARAGAASGRANVPAVTYGHRRTKIVCTIGPATASAAAVDRLVEAGMDAARLNFSHGTHEEHGERARLVRDAGALRPAAGADRRPAGAEAPGRRRRHPRILVEGDSVVLSGGENGSTGDLPVLPAVLTQVLQPGHEVLIDDGLSACASRRSTSPRPHHRRRRRRRGRAQGVNVPGVPIPFPR